jgi:hypothetical protein
MQRIIGLIGVKGAGKDTCAMALVEHFGFKRIAFADALYQEAAAAFDVTVAFLGNRARKEQDLPELCMARCGDPAFVACIAEELGQDVTPEFLQTTRSPRFILQYWGTEYRRHRGVDSYWVDVVNAAINSSPTQDYVITDVRFYNEYNYVRSKRGSLVRVRRPALETRESLERMQNGTAAHSSETELLEAPVDMELTNVEGEPGSLFAATAEWAQAFEAEVTV